LIPFRGWFSSKPLVLFRASLRSHFEQAFGRISSKPLVLFRASLWSLFEQAFGSSSSEPLVAFRASLWSLLGPEGPQRVAPPEAPSRVLCGEERGWGSDKKERKSPGRGDRILLRPNIPFVVFDAMHLQVGYQFLLKGDLAMMLLLPGNVLEQGRHV
jgi:hypothetical protein